MSLDKQQDMQAVLESMGEEYGIKFTPEQEKRFTLATTFECPSEVCSNSLTSRKTSGTKF